MEERLAYAADPEHTLSWLDFGTFCSRFEPAEVS